MQAGARGVEGCCTYGCRMLHVRLQAGARGVAGGCAWGCRHVHIRLQACMPATKAPEMAVTPTSKARPRTRRCTAASGAAAAAVRGCSTPRL